MLVHPIGNAPPAQLFKVIEKKAETPVVREKVFGLPVDREILFTDDHNVYRPGVEKRQRRWIVKLAFLKDFLLAGERVLRIATARSPIRWHEQLLTAGVFLGLERALLVFTTYRILHIPTTSDYRYRQSIAQVRYRDIRAIRLHWGRLVIDYKNGRRERFGAIPVAERKKIRQLLTALPMTKEVAQPVGRRHLCPRCTVVLSERYLRCRRCELTFKSKSMAGLMALLFPAGGHWYAKLFFPAFLFSLGELLALTAILAVGAGLVSLAVNPFLALAGLVFVWAGIKAVGWLHAEHFLQQYIPRKSKLGRWSPSMSAGTLAGR